MSALFVLFAISQSPIRDEVDDLLAVCENGVDLANQDPGEVDPQREICRAAGEALADAIGTVLVDADPYQKRVLGAWRVFDTAVAMRGLNGMSWTDETVKSATNDIRRLKFEVAQQAAWEAAQP